MSPQRLSRATPLPSLLAVLVGSIACQYTPDNFPCGTRTLTGEKVLTCDGEDEVCICQSNRCARRDSRCPGSNLRYVFKQGDHADTDPEGADLSLCVPLIEAVGVIDQLALPEDQRACPATPAPECGQTQADGQLISCGAGQACSCAEFQCAEKYESCDTGWRWTSTGVCLADLAPLDSQPNILTGLCNEATFPDQCGVPGFNGMPVMCPANTTCFCETNTCAIEVPTDVCPSGFARAVDYEPDKDPMDFCIEISDTTDSGTTDSGTTDSGTTDTGDGPGPAMDGFCPGWG